MHLDENLDGIPIAAKGLYRQKVSDTGMSKRLCDWCRREIVPLRPNVSRLLIVWSTRGKRERVQFWEDARRANTWALTF